MKKNWWIYALLAVGAYSIYKAYNMPQVRTRPVYQPVKSAETYDHLYTDAHLTDVSGGQGG